MSIESRSHHSPFEYFFSIPLNHSLNKKRDLHFRKNRLPCSHQLLGMDLHSWSENQADNQNHLIPRSDSLIQHYSSQINFPESRFRQRANNSPFPDVFISLSL